VADGDGGLVVIEQTDEMAYLIGQADKHRRAHEEALETIHKLERRAAQSEEKESPLRQSKSAILLSTPSPPTARQGPNSMFMPPVSEHIENSPRPTISSASTSQAWSGLSWVSRDWRDEEESDDLELVTLAQIVDVRLGTRSRA
jgi:hypothetical protein